MLCLIFFSLSIHRVWYSALAVYKQNNLTHLNTLSKLYTLPLEPRQAFLGGGSSTGDAKTYSKWP